MESIEFSWEFSFEFIFKIDPCFDELNLLSTGCIIFDLSLLQDWFLVERKIEKLLFLWWINLFFILCTCWFESWFRSWSWPWMLIWLQLIVRFGFCKTWYNCCCCWHCNSCCWIASASEVVISPDAVFFLNSDCVIGLFIVIE